MTNTPKTAVIIEEDYKGYFIRNALTREDFARIFPDAPAPTSNTETDTIRSLVHIWYVETEINSPLWETFFTDMTWELPDSDIENGVRAYIDPDQCSESLRAYVEATC